MDLIKEGDKVLYVWNLESKNSLEKDVTQLQNIKNVSVSVENTERLPLASYTESTFQKIILTTEVGNTNLLALFLKLLKPKGVLISKLAEDVEKAVSNLKLAGFINVTITDKNICSEKPNYEIGSTVKLSLPTSSRDKSKIAAVWKLDDDDDLVDADELLDNEDKVKPDPSSLRVCGTTGKRKACKDCTCGLAEELSNGKSTNNKNSQSSCGNCYLGDAFRCASCPYLGMPAFKPGEKVVLSENFLKADI